jgi:hypothetical protein
MGATSRSPRRARSQRDLAAWVAIGAMTAVDVVPAGKVILT